MGFHPCLYIYIKEVFLILPYFVLHHHIFLNKFLLLGFECAKLENECTSTLSDLAFRCPIIILF
jgi:hypothetical protein